MGLWGTGVVKFWCYDIGIRYTSAAVGLWARVRVTSGARKPCGGQGRRLDAPPARAPRPLPPPPPAPPTPITRRRLASPLPIFVPKAYAEFAQANSMLLRKH